VKSTSTIFSSPVSIRLSSGTSRIVVPLRPSVTRMPIDIELTRSAFGSSTVSIG
jgi:hypothetical protein